MLQRCLLAVIVLALQVSACDNSALPAQYQQIQIPEELLVSAEARARGRDLYLQHCALCHGVGADGKGVRQNLSSRPRSFLDPTWKKHSSPRSIYFVIQEGLTGTAMPAWKNLDKDQTWDLVAYLLSVSDPGS
jgi:mono/diheme cytochrome c family protein